MLTPIKYAMTKVMRIVEIAQEIEVKCHTRHSSFQHRQNPLVLQAILGASEGRTPDMALIFEMKHVLSGLTSQKEVHQVFEEAISHLKDKHVLNTYNLDYYDLPLYNTFIEAEVAMKLKHIENKKTLLMFKQVYELAKLFEDHGFIAFLEKERGSFIS